MTFPEFDAYSKALIDECLNMRDTKGKEYAGTKDRFDNFNRLALKCDLKRNLVWLVYFTKHMDAIESYINSGREFSSEGIRGRIVDAITYLLLLGGMIEEDLSKGSVTKPSQPYQGSSRCTSREYTKDVFCSLPEGHVGLHVAKAHHNPENPTIATWS